MEFISRKITEEDLKKIESKFTGLALLAIQGEKGKVTNFTEHIIKLS